MPAWASISTASRRLICRYAGWELKRVCASTSMNLGRVPAERTTTVHAVRAHLRSYAALLRALEWVIAAGDCGPTAAQLPGRHRTERSGPDVHGSLVLAEDKEKLPCEYLGLGYEYSCSHLTTSH